MVRNGLNDNSSFVARYLRVFPLTWNTWPCLRIEVYGRGKFLEKILENSKVYVWFGGGGGGGEREGLER